MCACGSGRTRGRNGVQGRGVGGRKGGKGKSESKSESEGVNDE
jgi:hypothetical protein